MKQKTFFIFFKGLSLKQTKHTILESKCLTLSTHCKHCTFELIILAEHNYRFLRFENPKIINRSQK